MNSSDYFEKSISNSDRQASSPDTQKPHFHKSSEQPPESTTLPPIHPQKVV